MKKPLLSVLIFLSFLTFLTVSSCKKTKTVNNPPTVTTQDVMLDLTSTTGQSGGTITSVGTAAISANGVVYSTSNKVPTVADDKTTDPVIRVSYTYTSNLTGLTPSTTYYLRAYATNLYGTAYGDVITFTTPATLSSVSGTVTTFAGSGAGGYSDGLGTGAQFNNPSGMVIDAQGNVYIADTYNNRIRKMAPDGTETTVADNGPAGYADGPAADAVFFVFLCLLFVV